MITIYTNVTNCYNRVAYLFASMCAQYFGVELSYLVVLFRAIQSMKMFLQTVFRVSEQYYSGNKGRQF